MFQATGPTNITYPTTPATDDHSEGAHPPSPTLEAQATVVSNATKAVYDAQAAVTAAAYPVTTNGTAAATPQGSTTPAENLVLKQADLATAEKELKDVTVKWNEYNVATLQGASLPSP